MKWEHKWRDNSAELFVSMLRDCPDSLSRVHTYRGPKSFPAVMSREAAGYKPGSTSPERIFSYTLRRARRIIENIFGVLSLKFRVLLKTIGLHPDKVESVIMSCIYLHNFLTRNSIIKGFYTPPGPFDSKDPDRN